MSRGEIRDVGREYCEDRKLMGVWARVSDAVVKQKRSGPCQGLWGSGRKGPGSMGRIARLSHRLAGHKFQGVRNLRPNQATRKEAFDLGM